MRSGETGLTAGRATAAYAVLLAVQTAASVYLFVLVFPTFQHMLSNIGTRMVLPSGFGLKVLSASVILQCAYWMRYSFVPVASGFQNVVIGHFVQFAGRASFFFASALFSTIFFRHGPEVVGFFASLEVVPWFFLIVGMLFSQFCYALELDRLGRSIEGTP